MICDVRLNNLYMHKLPTVYASISRVFILSSSNSLFLGEVLLCVFASELSRDWVKLWRVSAQWRTWIFCYLKSLCFIYNMTWILVENSVSLWPQWTTFLLTNSINFSDLIFHQMRGAIPAHEQTITLNTASVLSDKVILGWVFNSSSTVNAGSVLRNGFHLSAFQVLQD